MGRMVNPRQWDFNLGINLRRWLCCAKKVAFASSVVGVGAGIFAFVFADAGAVAVASVFAVIEKRSRHPLVW